MERRKNYTQQILFPISQTQDKLSMSFEKDQQIDSQTIKIISKEINKIRHFIHEREKISNLIQKFIMISEKYAIDIFNLTLDLKQNKNSLEGNFYIIFHDIIVTISNSMSKMLTNLSQHIKSKTNNSKGEKNKSRGFESKVQKLKNSLIEKMKDTERDKKLYLSECKNFEEYLVSKELTSQKKRKNNTYNNKVNNDNFEIIDAFEDNHKEVYDKQMTYKKSKEISNIIIQKIFCLIMNEKEEIHKDIYNYLNNFVTQTNECIQTQNIICLEQKNKLSLPILQLNYDKEEKTFQSLLNPDYYYFKCLRNVDYYFDDAQKKRDKMNAVKYLTECQLINIFKEVKKNKIMLSEFDQEKLKIAEKRNNIISIIKLIITDPKKYKEKYKKEFINLLMTDEDNLKAFIQYLNNNRSKLQYNFSKNAFYEIQELFTMIIEHLVKINELITLRTVFLMTSTYYIEENGTKKFMCNNIKKIKAFDESVFWANYLAASVQEELKKNEKMHQSKKYEISRRSLAIFASVITTIQNMIEFGISMEFINNFVEKQVNKNYMLSEENKKELKLFLDSQVNRNKNEAGNSHIYREKKQNCDNIGDIDKNMNIEDEIEKQIRKEDENKNDDNNSININGNNNINNINSVD